MSAHNKPSLLQRADSFFRLPQPEISNSFEVCGCDILIICSSATERPLLADFPCTLYQQSTKVLGASSILRCLTIQETVTPRLPSVAVS